MFDVIVVQWWVTNLLLCVRWSGLVRVSDTVSFVYVVRSCCIAFYHDQVKPWDAKEAFRPIWAVRSRIFVSNTAEFIRRKFAVRAVLSLISVSWVMDDNEEVLLDVREGVDAACFLFNERYKNILSKSIWTGLSLSFVYVVFNRLRVTIV